MDETTRYYRQFASEFFDSTVAVDMSPIRDRFAAMLIGTPIPWRQQPVVVAAGATADVPPPVPQAQPAITPPPPAFITPGGVQAVPPAVPIVPPLAP